MKIYLAGPMRGIELFNFPMFIRVAMLLRDKGHFVLNPAERDLAEGFNPALPIEHPENIRVFSLAGAFAWDFAAITKADAVALLPGWRESRGVQAELVLAMALHRPVYEFSDEDGELHLLELKSYTVTFE